MGTTDQEELALTANANTARVPCDDMVHRLSGGRNGPPDGGCGSSHRRRDYGVSGDVREQKTLPEVCSPSFVHRFRLLARMPIQRPTQPERTTTLVDLTSC